MKDREGVTLKDLGSIEVKVAHRWKVGESIATTPTARSVSNSIGIVSEKALKGRSLSHSVRYD